MKKLILIIVALSFLVSLSLAGNYVGAKKCRICHKGEKKGNIYEIWMKSRHHNAYETLKKAGEEKNPKCIGCHTTGYNKGGFKLGDPNSKKFEGIGCEVCHGAGSDYKKNKIMKVQKDAIKKGLLMPTEKTCIQCHNKKSPNYKKFDFKSFYKKIEHFIPKKKK